MGEDGHIFKLRAEESYGNLEERCQVEEGQDQQDKKYDTQEVQVCIDQGNAFLEEL